MCTIQCNMPVHCHFLPLPLGFSSTTWVPAVRYNRTPKAGMKYPEDYLEPWIFSKLHCFFNESSRLSMFERSQEMTHDGLKSPVKNYSPGMSCSRKKPWFTKAMVLIICSSNTIWLLPPPKGFLAICPLHHWYWMTLQMNCAAIYSPVSSGPVEVHISYRCDTVHLSASSKRTIMNWKLIEFVFQIYKIKPAPTGNTGRHACNLWIQSEITPESTEPSQ